MQLSTAGLTEESTKELKATTSAWGNLAAILFGRIYKIIESRKYGTISAGDYYR